jgi:hypothetical protein
MYEHYNIVTVKNYSLDFLKTQLDQLNEDYKEVLEENAKVILR